ncbi:MAG: CheR family methyltransferase [Bdellovibrionota bacterium]
MTDAEFAYFQRQLKQRTGMTLHCFPPGVRRRFFQRCLRPRLKELGLKDYSAYRSHLRRSSASAAEWQLFVDAIRINRTWFFRDLAPLEAACALLTKKKLRAWCCACSSGEEAFSVAMLLEAAKKNYRVLGTDLNSEVVIAAGLGFFPRKQVRREVPREAQRFFVEPARGKHSALLTVHPRLRKKVTFALQNLLQGKPPSTRFDLIVCRNVLFYFDARARRTALIRLWKSAAPGAILLVSADDGVERVRSPWRRIAPLIYQKPLSAKTLRYQR